MYEELVKSLRLCGRMINADDNCIAYYDGSCERWPVCVYDLMKQAADAIEVLSKKETTTNADRIRAMSDEELAGLVCGGCPPVDRCFYDDNGEEEEPNCFKCWLDWLRQEVSE